VRALLDAGRLADALAVVAPAYAAQNPELAQRITHRVSTTIRTVRDPLGELRHNGTVRSLRTLHRALPSGLWSLILLGAGLLTLAVGFALRAGRADGRSPTAVTAVTVGGAAAFAAVAGLLILFSSPDPLRTLVGSGSLPPALAEIVADIDDGLRGGLVGTYLRLLAVVVFLAVALAAPHLFRRLRSVTRRPPTRVLAAGSALAVAAALTATTLPSPPRVTTCNGYAALCVVPYDSVTYLAAHNAMAASDAGFVDAEQDPTIIGQLDNGVRALLIDFHYWTAPEQVTRYVDSLSPRTRALIAPFLTTLESRPGVWLCHIVCQLGASPAVGTLRAVGEWLAAHRDAVLTLIIEDHTSLADTEATIEDAGLRRYVQPPPAPDTAWPTLGQMVRSGHRLVVFTERQDDPQGWLRNYHLIGAETPFRAASPAQLTCAPGRGPAKAPLFLLNNWISSSAPSRTDAATVNSPRFLLRRARQCARERGMTPTYIAVDFAEIGNPLRAVAMLNRVSPGS
jgi:hypothetical protein